MKDQAADPKQEAILMSAWRAFATYGFRKTSMDDIARGAGMSRPALYLRYKNKEDIFRRLVQLYYDEAVENVAVALGQQGTAAEVLQAAFSAHLGERIEAMLTSPHGMELLDAGAVAASDIKDAGERRLEALYVDWLGAQAAAGRIALPDTPEQVAATIVTALKGVKTSGAEFQSIQKRLPVLARLFGDGLGTG